MSKISRRSSQGKRFVLSVAASASALAPACADVHPSALESTQRGAGNGAPLDPRIDAGHLLGLVTLPVGTMVVPPVPISGLIVTPPLAGSPGIAPGTMVAPPSAGAVAPPSAGAPAPPGVVVSPFAPDASGFWAGTTVCPPEVCPILDGGADD